MRRLLDRHERLNERQRPLSWLLALAILTTLCMYCLGLASCVSRRQAGTPTPVLQPTLILTATAFRSPTPVPVATTAPTLRPSATLTFSFVLADTATPLPTPFPAATKTTPPTAAVTATTVKPTATAEPGPSPTWAPTPTPTEPLAPTATRAPTVTPAEPLTNPVIRFNPATSTAQVGTTFVVEIEVDAVVDLGSYELTVTFNPTVVNVQGVTPGSFLGSTGRSVTPLGPITDNGAGRLTFGAFSFGTASGPGGRGTIAQVTLQAVAAGSSNLAFTQAQLTDTVGRLLVPLTTIPGSVTVP